MVAAPESPGRARPSPAVPRPRGAHGRGSGRGRSGPGRHRRALRALRAARALPAGRGHPGPGPGARPRQRTWPPWASSSWGFSTATRARRCCGTGSTGTTPGLEAKELWPAFRRLARCARGRGGRPPGGRGVQRGARAGGLHPDVRDAALFTGRSTLEGVYNQASLTTHAVYYLASELGATSPNPFREIEYSRFDTRGAPSTTCGSSTCSEVVALSPQLTSALHGAPGRERSWSEIPPYSLFQLEGGSGPVRRARARSRRCGAPRPGWREKALRWFTRRPLPGAPRLHRRRARGGAGARSVARAPGGAPAAGGRTDARRSSRRPSRSGPTVPATRCSSRSPGTRAGGRRAPRTLPGRAGA